MPNEQLVAYIKENASKFPKQTLTQALMAQGWAVADIAAAFSVVETQAVGAPASVSASPVEDQNAHFLEEMERHRKEAGGSQPIVEGNTEIHPGANYLRRETDPSSEAKGIIGMIMRTGLIKNEQQANIVMIVFIILMLSVTGWLLLPHGSSAPVAAPALIPSSDGAE